MMKKTFQRALLVCFALFCFTWSQAAYAICLYCSDKTDPTKCALCTIETLQHRETREDINDKVETEFESQREDYFLKDFVEKFWIPALQAMTQQVDSGYFEIGVQNSTSTSTVSDAKTANVVAAQTAEIASEVAASDAMCERVTLSENIAPTAAVTTAAADTLGQITNASLTGMRGTPTSTERQIRNLEVASQTYWSPADLNGVVGQVTGFAPAEINADLSAPFFENYTFDIDYRDDTTNPTEQAMEMLRYNIYGAGPTRLRTIDQNTAGFDEALTSRYEVIAYGSAAQSSFNALTALHHPGIEGSGTYYRALLNSRGITDEAQIEALLGKNDAPSLLAQAKILALYTNATPQAGVDTMNVSADTRRLAIAQMGARLLIKYELYKSLQRSALQLALLHELKIRPYQRAYEGTIGMDPLGENDTF